MAAILFLPSESRTVVFLTSSLDRCEIKNILFITLFFLKWSRLATGLFCPVFEWSSFRMVQLSNGRDWHKIELDKTGQSGFWMLTVVQNSICHCSLLRVSYSIVNHDIKSN
jgi:hypothetical protein